MGVSDPDQLFLSEKDLTTMDLNFLVKPMLEFHQKECQIPPLNEDCNDHDHHELLHQKQQEEEGGGGGGGGKKYEFMVSSLNLKLQPPREFGCDDIDDQNDGFRTPTSSDHKIPVVLQCPPAPRKPRSLPSKRKSSCQRVLVLDLSKEIESLFPPNLVGNKIKKVRQESQDNK
ncbi:hypothetical protein HS088_TW02G00478 [Tripterygium wilfordii]|uniref:Cyclin-dependent protein kinase inhibitor SMR3-like n=1 Tax=Tripterygium wilfordii TaxID=458696 RepID=A0A7J7DZ51_TRIWF|nr:cyclin-dependent protein kinase inhibitor SMR3-like [Tripterygium wilfordii]KAF5751464.1 hypothetical protein HS088_TW02G00478 [Tripterygium wilfordii]